MKKMWVAFAVQKLLTFFQQKSRILYIESAKTVNEMTLNELVKLTMLWTTGPRLFYQINVILLSLITYGKFADQKIQVFLQSF